VSVHDKHAEQDHEQTANENTTDVVERRTSDGDTGSWPYANSGYLITATSSQCLEHGIQSTDKQANVLARVSSVWRWVKAGVKPTDRRPLSVPGCGRSIDNESETLKRRRRFGSVHLPMTCESIFVVATARQPPASTSTRRPVGHGERRQEAVVKTTLGGPSISHNRCLNELQRSWEFVCFSPGEGDLF